MKSTGTVSVDDVLAALRTPPTISNTPINIDAQKIATAATVSATKNVVKSLVPRIYAWSILILFLLSNIGIGVLVFFAYNTDIEFIRAGKSIARLIDPDVIKALITGLSIQTGTAFILVTGYFFARSKQLLAESVDTE